MENVSSSNGLELYPKLRFPEFTDPWKSCHLGDIYDERIERGGNEVLLSVTINNGVILRSEIEGKDNSSDDKKNYKTVEIGDMVYNTMRMWQGANGISSYSGIVSPAYTVLKARQKIDNNFFEALFKNNLLINRFRCYSQGLTSDTWNLKYPQIKSIKVSIPEYSEQQKIATMINIFNNRIEMQLQYVNDLKKYKRGLIRKYFEEKGTWKKVPFWDCVEIASSLVDPTIEPYMYMPHIGTANIEKFTGRLLPCKKAYEEGLTSGKYLFNSECIIYSKIRPELSKVAYPGFTGICSADAYPLKPKEGIMPEIIYYELLSERFVQFATKTSTRTKMPKINQEELSGFSFLIPPLEVQKEIIPFLRKFDLHLLYQEEELQNYVKIKKSLIQQLFI